MDPDIIFVTDVHTVFEMIMKVALILFAVYMGFKMIANVLIAIYVVITCAPSDSENSKPVETFESILLSRIEELKEEDVKCRELRQALLFILYMIIW